MRQPYPAKDGENLLQQCLSLGFNLPYFCWHPALGSVGACRQCAIKQFKNEEDKRGKIVMACMTPATDGTRISIDDPEAREFRASVIEWLMVNHPHDCPVCDEGGECHLQDMTVMTGHVYRRYRGRKRTFHNQNLGPLVNHEMNRCIQCYRCTRFYRDYAGGRDFDALVLRNQVYFGRHQDGTLESEFSGNLVEVCPTGVFTDKTLKQHYTRKWDLQTAPSVCVHCATRAATPFRASVMARCGVFTIVSTARSMATFCATAGAMVMNSSIASAESGNPSAKAQERTAATCQQTRGAPAFGEDPVQWSQGDRHRFSARFDRSQFCAAHAGWTRTVLSRTI